MTKHECILTHCVLSVSNVCVCVCVCVCTRVISPCWLNPIQGSTGGGYPSTAEGRHTYAHTTRFFSLYLSCLALSYTLCFLSLPNWTLFLLHFTHCLWLSLSSLSLSLSLTHTQMLAQPILIFLFTNYFSASFPFSLSPRYFVFHSFGKFALHHSLSASHTCTLTHTNAHTESCGLAGMTTAVPGRRTQIWLQVRHMRARTHTYPHTHTHTHIAQQDHCSTGCSVGS